MHTRLALGIVGQGVDRSDRVAVKIEQADILPGGVERGRCDPPGFPIEDPLTVATGQVLYNPPQVGQEGRLPLYTSGPSQLQ